MSDAPPQLGDIPQHSEMKVPTLSTNHDGNLSITNGNKSVQNAKDAAYTSEVRKLHNRSLPKSSCDFYEMSDQYATDTQSVFNTISNHPMTESLKDTAVNGPVAESVKDQHEKTTAEFRNLADSRRTPSTSTATGQPLTHYHSFFYNLLSWKNPRATTLSFISNVLFILAARYLPALRWGFKGLYVVLGITALAEVAGKLVLNQGLASSFRPKKYYTIPREAFESLLEDVEQLINFFVIEFQRVLFAEKVVHTIAAFASALVSYWLIKFLPFWGLSLTATSIIYLAPLIYISNQELIDNQVSTATDVINSQATQVKELAGHHTSRATETVKTYTADYTSKAQEYIGSARGRSSSPEILNKSRNNAPVKSESEAPSSYSSTDFPHAPKQEPTPGVASHAEQYEKSQFSGQAQVAS